MSDETNIAIIGDTKIHGKVKSALEIRVYAVEIALELIKSSCAGKGEDDLSLAMDKLSKHADTIQAALKEPEE
ncbi:hypothetical protein [Candidatus Spongiihabitans sp.]|uniref:hypothetical protein n=1 Tax=Candidatus Spongiihabitans sp. TaxID=3101308 RepID=UPI003C7C6E01